jgi:class 3 adenylate cyclase
VKATGGSWSSPKESADRIDEILAAADDSYKEVKSIPSRDELTFTNGFYANCTAIFVDIRDSSKLPDKYKRPTLAKIYRSFISENVAAINAAERCAEVNIHGDAVWGVIDTPYKPDIDATFELAARLHSLTDLLNCRFRKRGIDDIRTGIGLAYGRVLMIKAGHKGSAINEVVWMGDVVNEAARLCNQASRGWNSTILLDDDVYGNLKDDYQKMCSRSTTLSCYESNAVNTAVNNWIKDNCK